MKILIFGAAGMLGHKLVQVLGGWADVWTTLRNDKAAFARLGLADTTRIIENIDVMNEASVRDVLRRISPDVVINAVGIIKQLPTANDVETSLSINSIFPHRLSRLSDELGFKLICISTDCVFTGKKGMYREDDTPDAIDLYGTSKRLGEVVSGNALTLRTSIIGRELSAAHSLIEWLISNRKGRIRGFTKAIYSGFPTIVFADIIGRLIFEHCDLRGLYHVSSDPISKYALLNLVNEAYGLDIEIEPTEEVEIDRSLDSASFRSATGIVPEPWTELVEKMVSDPTPYDEWRTRNS